MKKIIALLLCCIMLISLFSCIDNSQETFENSDYDHNNESNDGNELDNADSNTAKANDYSRAIELYRSAVNIFPKHIEGKGQLKSYHSELGIVDLDEQTLFNQIFNCGYNFFEGRNENVSPTTPYYKLPYGYAIKDLDKNGTDELILMKDDYSIVGLITFYNGRPISIYSYFDTDLYFKIDADGTLHNYSIQNGEHTVFKISDNGTHLEIVERFGTKSYEADDNLPAHTIYYKLTGDTRIQITQEEYQKLTLQYGDFLSAEEAAAETKQNVKLDFVSLFKEVDIAEELFNRILTKNGLVIDNTDTERNLGNLHFLNEIKLSESGTLQKATADIDGDGINEVIIKGDGDNYIILRYEKGQIYARTYGFTYPLKEHGAPCFYYFNTCDLKEDGSFYWTAKDGENNIRGQAKFAFEDGNLTYIMLWRIVNEGKPNAEYYIGNDAVTYEEITEYIYKSTKKPITYAPLETTWIKEISLEEAEQIAANHWRASIEDFDKQIADLSLYLLRNEGWLTDNYVIDLIEYRDGTRYIIDTVRIDAHTGEIYNQATDTDGTDKG